jgi:hypothetical protein
MKKQVCMKNERMGRERESEKKEDKKNWKEGCKKL